MSTFYRRHFLGIYLKGTNTIMELIHWCIQDTRPTRYVDSTRKQKCIIQTTDLHGSYSRQKQQQYSRRSIQSQMKDIKNIQYLVTLWLYTLNSIKSQFKPGDIATEIQNKLNEAKPKKKLITLMWVARYTGIKGNESADQQDRVYLRWLKKKQIKETTNNKLLSIWKQQTTNRQKNYQQMDKQVS